MIHNLQASMNAEHIRIHVNTRHVTHNNYCFPVIGEGLVNIKASTCVVCVCVWHTSVSPHR